MDPVSASMLLSEVNPTQCAQVSIVNLLVFEERIKFVDFRNQFVSSVIDSDPHSRFKHVIDCSGAFPKWSEASPNWHPFDNFSRVSEDHDLGSVNQLISKRLTEPLPITKPVWDALFVEKFRSDDGGIVSAVLLTIHHSMGDGFTLSQQIMRRCAPADSNQCTMEACFPFRPTQHTSQGSKPNPISLLLKIISSICKLLLMQKNPSGPLRMNRPRQLSDRIVTSIHEIPIPVVDMKKISKKLSEKLFSNSQQHSFSINDLIVTAVTVAFQSQFATVHHDITSSVWVSMSHDGRKRFEWGNHNLGVGYIQLPISEKGGLVSIARKCHDNLHDLKSSPEPLIANKLLSLLGSFPQFFTRPFRYLLMDKMSTSISNFPGPVLPIRFPVQPAGAATLNISAGIGTIKHVFFLVAPPMSFGPYVTIISYCGKMYLGSSVNESLMNETDLEKFAVSSIPNAIRQIDSVL